MCVITVRFEPHLCYGWLEAAGVLWAAELQLKHSQLAEKWLTFVRDERCLKIADLISFKRSLGVDAFQVKILGVFESMDLFS